MQTPFMRSRMFIAPTMVNRRSDLAAVQSQHCLRRSLLRARATSRVVPTILCRRFFVYSRSCVCTSVLPRGLWSLLFAGTRTSRSSDDGRRRHRPTARRAATRRQKGASTHTHRAPAHTREEADERRRRIDYLTHTGSPPTPVRSFSCGRLLGLSFHCAAPLSLSCALRRAGRCHSVKQRW